MAAFSVESIIPPHTEKLDFNGDGFTDLLWRGSDGTIAIWNRSADGLEGTSGLYIMSPPSDLTVKGLGDFNRDGTNDILYQNYAGAIEIWLTTNNQVGAITPLMVYGANGPQIVATGNFNGSGPPDILRYYPPVPVSGGENGTWITSDASDRRIPSLGLGRLDPISLDYKLVGVGDFNGDGRDDILMRGTGNAAVGTFLIVEPQAPVPGNANPTKLVTFRDPGSSWAVLALDDFNGDGKTDILWQHANSTGQVDGRAIWLMDGGAALGGAMLLNPGPDWNVVATGDYNNDGKADLMWHHGPTGANAEWFMDGLNIKAFGAWIENPGNFWTLGGV